MESNPDAPASCLSPTPTRFPTVATACRLMATGCPGSRPSSRSGQDPRVSSGHE